MTLRPSSSAVPSNLRLRASRAHGTTIWSYRVDDQARIVLLLKTHREEVKEGLEKLSPWAQNYLFDDPGSP